MRRWPSRVVFVATLVLLNGAPSATGGVAQEPGPCPVGASCDTIAAVDPGARFHVRETLDPGADSSSWYFGNPDDVPLMGDWDCDGLASPAMFRPGNGFVYLRNDRAPGPAEIEFFFGNPGDVPLAGDFDGDGCDTISIYRPHEARMYVTNRLGNGRADIDYAFGDPGDRPFAADFDGDGVDTLGLHRPSTGFLYFRNSHQSGRADFEFFFGDPGDVLMAGDWNGDGMDTVAVHRPDEQRVYFRLSNTPGAADHILPVAAGVDVLPVASAPSPSLFGVGWEEGIGARVDRAAVSIHLHVDPAHPDASDSNPGTVAQPLATISGALDLAQDHRSAGLGVRVVIEPGVYRESLEIVGPNLAGADPVLVLEATEPGTVTVSGSDVWSDWEPAPGGMWTATWPHDWGLAPIPPGWDEVDVSDLVRRREMVFVDGAALTQVPAEADLGVGTFTVDEVQDRLRLVPHDQGGFASAEVEVAVRPEALRILLTDHVVVDGLAFTHANSGLGNAVSVLESDDVLLENVSVDWNNWGGLQLYDASRVSVTDSSASHNGGRGVGMADADHVLMQAIDTSFNNWRGAAGGFTGWSVGGTKVHHLHDAIFRDVAATGNEARGFWLDTDNARVFVDGAVWCDNLRDGFFVEATQGPLLVQDAVMCDNGDHGLLSANAVGLQILDSVVCGNGRGQIEFSGLQERVIDVHATGGTLALPAASDWVVAGNEVFDAGGAAVLVGTTLAETVVAELAATLDAHHNQWRSRVVDAFEAHDGTFVRYAEWQALVGDGPGSAFASSAGPEECAP